MEQARENVSFVISARRIELREYGGCELFCDRLSNAKARERCLVVLDIVQWARHDAASFYLINDVIRVRDGLRELVELRFGELLTRIQK